MAERSVQYIVGQDEIAGIKKTATEENVYYNTLCVQTESEDYDEMNFADQVDDNVNINSVGKGEVCNKKENIQVPTKTNTEGLFVVRKLQLIIAVCVLSIIIVALVAVGIITYHVTKHGGTEALTMDGGWSTWSSWDTCSATCGIGQKQRRRQCDNSKACEGDAMESQVCFNTSCPDGAWSTWSTWDTCSATCGTGLTQRRRQCDNPTPSSFGKPCDGDSTESQLCFNITCPDSKSSFSVDDPVSNINSYLTFSDVIYNLGGDFEVSSGLFTCTKPGVYVFSFSLVKKRSSSRVDRVYCHLRKNGVSVIRGYVDPTDDDTDKGSAYVSHTVILHMDVTDTVGLWACTDPSTTMEHWTSFSGFLLYPDDQN